MRTTCVLLIFALLTACSDDDTAVGGYVNPSQLNSSGEVALADGSSLAFSITSERYKQWDAAQRALDRRVASQFGVLLKPASPTARSISSAVAYLEQDAMSKQVVERAGLTVRGFVELTVALEQQMRLASEKSATRAEPMPAPYAPPMDSGYAPAPRITPEPVTTSLANQRARDTPSDTLFPTPVARDSTPRRDTIAARRDSLTTPKRDSAVPPERSPRDSVRDTLLATPDSIR